MVAPTDDEWHDGWRLQWDADADLDSDTAANVIAAFDRLIAGRAKPTGVKRSGVLDKLYDRLLDDAEWCEAMGSPELAAMYRAALERIDVAAADGKSAKHILEMLFNEQAAKDALIAYRGDRADPEKLREARLRLYLLSGRWLDPDEEWRIDKARNPDGSSTISRVAGRIIDRVKLY
jgi:hypothetical protein